MQIYLETSSPQWVNNGPKLPGVNYVAKNWALVVMLKALPLANFSSALLVKYTLVKWVQNLSMCRKFPQNRLFLTDCFSVNLAPKFPQNCQGIGWFFHKSVFEIPAKFDFFSRYLSVVLLRHSYVYNRLWVGWEKGRGRRVDVYSCCRLNKIIIVKKNK